MCWDVSTRTSKLDWSPEAPWLDLCVGLLWGSWWFCCWLGGLLPPQTHTVGQQSDQGGSDVPWPEQPVEESRTLLHGGTVPSSWDLFCCHCAEVFPYSHDWHGSSWPEGVADAKCWAGVWNLSEGCVSAALHHRSRGEVWPGANGTGSRSKRQTRVSPKV